MSKNLTRKGLAFGAIVALGTTLFAGAPASAAGIDNGSVSLAPTAGAEYDIIAGGNLALKANSASGVTGSGKYLKFQVEDAAAKTTVLYTSSTQYSVTTDGTDDILATDSTGTAADVVTIQTGAHKFKVGDRIQLSGVGDANDGDSPIDDATDFWALTAVDASSVTFEVPAASYTSTIAATTDDAMTVSLAASVPATGKYIYDTKNDSNASDKTISLQSTDEDATQTVTVTAWIDDNDNGTIDSTEYQSPARVVRFLKHSEVTPTVSFNPIAVGSDSNVVATVTFSPVLNGSQLSNADNRTSAAGAVTANFTRPGSSATLASATTTYSNTTKQWTITSANMNATTGDDVEVAGTTDTGWAIAQPTGSLLLQSVSITKNVVTATTSTTAYATGNIAAHGLQVGDIVNIDADTARATNSAAKVLSVPSTTTFTYAVTTANESTADVAATAQTTASIATTGGSTKILRNFAVAGTYSAQVLLYKDASTNALTKLGAAAASSGVAVTASSATIESVSSATLSATASNAATVFTGTKTAAFVGKVLDVDGAAVGAGLDAAITATTVTSAGTVKINGTTVVTGTVVYAKTDANGQVAISVENSSALAGESIVLDLDIQGVDATDVTATWGGKVYSIVDLNDNSAVASGARTRAVADGASYTFNLLVQDQFKAPAGSDIRLKAVVAGRSSSTQIVTLAAGKATLVAADAGLATSGDTTVNLSFQALSSGVWSDVDTASYNDWDGAAGNDLAGVAIKYYTQTDALTLNADAANYPSTTAADFAAATTTKALVAVDSRVSNTAATSVVAAGKAVVSGAVTNSSTGVAKSGQVVSVSGAGLLFKSGDVWSIGSASAIAADGTFAFEVYSNNPGTKVVTVTSGSLTKTASLVFTGASSATRVLTISGAQEVLPGSTLQANILLVDGNGNGVDTVAPATTPASEYIKVSYDGPGLLSGSALPTETDADGKASVRYLLGVGDRGTATVTVKFDKNFDGDFVDATDITVTRTYYIGVAAPSAATAAVAGSTGKVYASVSNAAGKTVVIKINGVTKKTFAGTLAKKTVVVYSTAGAKNVSVFVGGVRVATKVVTIK